MTTNRIAEGATSRVHLMMTRPQSGRFWRRPGSWVRQVDSAAVFWRILRKRVRGEPLRGEFLGQTGWLLCGHGTKRAGDLAPLVGVGRGVGEVDDDAAHRHFDPGTELEQAQT